MVSEAPPNAPGDRRHGSRTRQPRPRWRVSGQPRPPRAAPKGSIAARGPATGQPPAPTHLAGPTCQCRPGAGRPPGFRARLAGCQATPRPHGELTGDVQCPSFKARIAAGTRVSERNKTWNQARLMHIRGKFLCKNHISKCHLSKMIATHCFLKILKKGYFLTNL